MTTLTHVSGRNFSRPDPDARTSTNTDENGGIDVFCEVIKLMPTVPDVFPLSKNGTMFLLSIVEILLVLDTSQDEKVFNVA